MNFKTLLIASLLLVAVVPAKAEEQALNESQRAEVEKIVTKLLRENPEIVIDALKAYEQQQAAAQREQQSNAIAENREQIMNDPGDPFIGNPEGDVTLVEFFDYACGYCKRVFPAVKKLVEEDGNIKLVMKEFPILGEASVLAARVSLSANKQGKYHDFHSKLMALKGQLSEAAILGVAKEIGLDMKQVEQDKTSPELNAVISRNMELAQALGINGTPSFVISDILIPGAVSLAELQQMVEMTRAHSKAN